MKKSKFIFFLQLGRSLPDSYFKLAAYLSEQEVALVPIKSKDLVNSIGASEHKLIVIIDNMKNLKRAKEVRRFFLNFAITGKKVTLFELSSFAPISPNNKLKNDNYIHIPLPIDIAPLSDYFVRFIEKEGSKKERLWPGGRRGNLPGKEIF